MGLQYEEFLAKVDRNGLHGFKKSNSQSPKTGIYQSPKGRWWWFVWLPEFKRINNVAINKQERGAPGDIHPSRESVWYVGEQWPLPRLSLITCNDPKSSVSALLACDQSFTGFIRTTGSTWCPHSRREILEIPGALFRFFPVPKGGRWGASRAPLIRLHTASSLQIELALSADEGDPLSCDRKIKFRVSGRASHAMKGSWSLRERPYPKFCALITSVLLLLASSAWWTGWQRLQRNG